MFDIFFFEIQKGRIESRGRWFALKSCLMYICWYYNTYIVWNRANSVICTTLMILKLCPPTWFKTMFNGHIKDFPLQNWPKSRTDIFEWGKIIQVYCTSLTFCLKFSNDFHASHFKQKILRFAASKIDFFLFIRIRKRWSL